MPGAQRRGHATAPVPPRPISRESTQPASVLDDADCDSIMSASRPPSLALMPPSSACSNPASPPSLRDILTNTAPPPYTLSAFTAFLSQNHCMETLEFTMDADRYSTAYANFVQREQPVGSKEGNDHVSSLWQKIMSAYIVPYGHREVNLPSRVRDRLLSLPYTPVPPDPSELDEAVRIVYELMNDSVLGPFIASVMPQHDWTEEHDPRYARTRLRIPRDISSNSDDTGRSPKVGFLPMFNMPWTTEPKSSNSSSSESGERGLTDSNLNTPSPASNEPMTPPTTPPVSDWEFSGSPGNLHRATSSHSSGWKKGLQVMPMPEDTVATSPDRAPPVAPEMHVDDHETQAKEHSPDMSSDWEEPHPGQRYSIHVVGNAGTGVAANVNGVGRVGMAAKAYSPYPPRGWTTGARRFAPPRIRTPSRLRPSKGPQDDPRLSIYTTTSSCHNASSTAPMLPHAEALKTPTGSSPLCCTLLTKKSTATLCPSATASPDRSACPAPDDDTSSVRLSMADVSGLLNPGLTTITTSSTDASSYMSLENTTTPERALLRVPSCTDGDRMDLDPDPYGWEAELEKRVVPCVDGAVGLGVSDCCPVSVVQYHRAGGGKRTLLQRVLSFGPSAVNTAGN
ncbi:hypothetical protein P885DRAFT_45272 [Corynascus similis CBS 632.67]